MKRICVYINGVPIFDGHEQMWSCSSIPSGSRIMLIIGQIHSRRTCRENWNALLRPHRCPYGAAAVGVLIIPSVSMYPPISDWCRLGCRTSFTLFCSASQLTYFMLLVLQATFVIENKIYSEAMHRETYISTPGMRYIER
jgi:hypothetical protein